MTKRFARLITEKKDLGSLRFLLDVQMFRLLYNVHNAPRLFTLFPPHLKA